MSSEKTPPSTSEKGRAELDERQRRQAEQLRANLARRKQQSRARAEAGPPGGAKSED